MKASFYTTLIVCVITLIACESNNSLKSYAIHFETMGTFGQVTIIDSNHVDTSMLKKEINEILIDFNQSLSTYIDSSVISKYNRGEGEQDSLLQFVQDESLVVNVLTQGAFNPKIDPLYKYWRYLDEEAIIDSAYIDSLLVIVNDYDKFDTITRINPISLEQEYLIYFNQYPTKVDFSAIAKGLGVDIVAQYLSDLGFQNFMVEIGGEVVCKGLNQENSPWRIGIEEPIPNVRQIFEVIELSDKAMATSGNYRNFKVLSSGQKIVHIINPKTGYPEISNLLSASIIAESCMEADAYATACMVMGLDSCYNFILNNPYLDAYLIYSDENGELKYKATPLIKELILQ